MTVLLKNGKFKTYPDEYAARLIEQGLAVPFSKPVKRDPPGKKKKNGVKKGVAQGES